MVCSVKVKGTGLQVICLHGLGSISCHGLQSPHVQVDGHNIFLGLGPRVLESLRTILDAVLPAAEAWASIE